MNAVVPQFEDDYEGGQPKWILQKLTPKHQQALALIAQGMKLVQVAPIVGFTPQYLTMLLRQPLVQDYLKEKAEVVGARLEAMFEQTVEVIADTMKSGSNNEKLKAARLQLEATKRIGRGDTLTVQVGNSEERLARLSERLVGLLHSARGETFNEDGTPAENPQILKYVSGRTSGQAPAAKALEHQRTEEPRTFQDDQGNSQASE